jgi:hypothetical protein
VKYKVIKSVAHNWAHSFASTLNWHGHDYAMSHLLRVAVARRESELRVDLLTGAAGPAALLIPPVREALDFRRGMLARLLQSQGVPPAVIRAATASIRFDLERAQAGEVEGAPVVEAPFTFMVVLLDDRGKEHVGTVRDRWIAEVRPTWLSVRERGQWEAYYRAG